MTSSGPIEMANISIAISANHLNEGSVPSHRYRSTIMPNMNDVSIHVMIWIRLANR